MPTWPNVLSAVLRGESLSTDDAAWAMIELLQNQKNLSRLDAYSLSSMVMDCRLAAPFGPQKAVHCLLPKSTWVASR